MTDLPADQHPIVTWPYHDKDQTWLMLRFGMCEFCGKARTVRDTTTTTSEGVHRHRELVCSVCGRQAT